MPIVLVVLVLIFVGVVKVWEYSPLVFILLVATAAIVAFSIVESKSNRIKKVKESFVSRVDFYGETLVKKFSQTVYQDDYGRLVQDKWNKEKAYFIDKILKSEKEGADFSVLDLAWMMRVIDERVDILKDKFVCEDHDVNDMSPVDFEHHCADILRKSGWSARVTQASGDQGIDVIAEISNIKAVFQCKKYSKPVGNYAVQEIIAGKVFEKADVAAVVTNSSYTKSARLLAQSSGVYLLHVSELASFNEELKLSA